MDRAFTVSVALCTHNGADYIREQLESILAQTEAVDEIVISDDASTDETLAIIDAVIEESGGSTIFKVLQNETPLGVTANFQQAMTHASGDFIALSDQDDIWIPEKIAEILAEFESHPSLELVFTNARIVDADAKDLGYSLFTALELNAWERRQLNGGNAFQAFLRRNLATGATVVVRKSLVTRAVPFPDAWLHDEWLAILAAAAGTIRIVERPLIQYRQHQSNQVGMLKLSFSEKLKMVSTSRGERDARLLARSHALMEYAAGNPGFPPEYRRLADSRFRFEEVRTSLPVSRIARIPKTLRLLSQRKYHRFGRGIRSFIRDLFQPE